MKNQQNFNRGERIASKVQILVAEILRDNYPDISVTLTGTESRGGLQFMKIYFQGDVKFQKRLDGAKDTIRYELAARMNQKYVPNLQFIYDDTLEKAQRVEELLKGIQGIIGN